MKLSFCLILSVCLAVLAKAQVDEEQWLQPTVEEAENSIELDEWELQFIEPKSDGELTGTELPNPEAGVVVPSTESRIVGGYTAYRGQFPWQALLQMDNRALCGGSLISVRWILTAAHCAQGFTNFMVVLGARDRTVNEAGRQVFQTTSKRVHGLYNTRNLNNDVALVQLRSNAVISSYVNTVRLPRSSQRTTTFVNWNAVVSGWGKTSDASNTAAVLQGLNRQIISNAECAQTYGISVINSASICINAKDRRNICNGDSGGPLVIRESDSRWTLLGVASFGSTRGCASGAPGGFQRVTSHLSWISTYTGIAIRS